MNINIPKCYLDPPNRLDKYDKNSYAKVENKGSLFSREFLGYDIKGDLKEETNLKFNFFGVQYIVDEKFHDLVEEINDSLYIPTLEEGWGDNGAVVSEDTYKSAVRFMLLYSSFILDTYGLVIDTPEINPVRNGSVDLLWNTKNGYMLVNVKMFKTQYLGTFFGFKKENKKIKEGEIDLNTIEPEMALFMSTLI